MIVWINKIIAKLLISGEIKQALEGFKEGRKSFPETKAALQEIVKTFSQKQD